MDHQLLKMLTSSLGPVSFSLSHLAEQVAFKFLFKVLFSHGGEHKLEVEKCGKK